MSSTPSCGTLSPGIRRLCQGRLDVDGVVAQLRLKHGTARSEYERRGEKILGERADAESGGVN